MADDALENYMAQSGGAPFLELEEYKQNYTKHCNKQFPIHKELFLRLSGNEQA